MSQLSIAARCRPPFGTKGSQVNRLVVIIVAEDALSSAPGIAHVIHIDIFLDYDFFVTFLGRSPQDAFSVDGDIKPRIGVSRSGRISDSIRIDRFDVGGCRRNPISFVRVEFDAVLFCMLHVLPAIESADNFARLAMAGICSIGRRRGHAPIVAQQ